MSCNIKIINGDCLAVLKEMKENSVNMIFSDPPYNLSNGGTTCHAGKRVSVDKGKWDKSEGFESDVKFHRNWITECKRVLKPEGSIWITGTSHSIYQCGFILQELGFHILNDIAWYKPNASPNLSCTVFAHSHETILWAKKDKKAKHTYNYKTMKELPFEEDKLKSKGKQMRSVWSIPTPPNGEKEFGKHPAQKPIALLKRIILASTKEGDTILDPFNGSGTTAVACKMIGDRNYIGIEIEKEYVELTNKRLALLNKGELFNDPWEVIFNKYDILKHDFNKSVYIINAEKIKEATKNLKRKSDIEVRLLCKHDTRESRPKIFQDNKLFILPTKNREFAIIKGEGYIDIPAIKSEAIKYKSKSDFELDTSKVGNSEMQHPDFAYASSMVRTFSEDSSLVPTIRGRKYTPAFSFNVCGKEVFAKGGQTEVAIGYEGKNKVVLVEAKNSNTTNIIIRQLYYPYRQWSEYTKKEIQTLFFEKQGNKYLLWEFDFKNKNDYNSIYLKKSKQFLIN